MGGGVVVRVSRGRIMKGTQFLFSASIVRILVTATGVTSRAIVASVTSKTVSHREIPCFFARCSHTTSKTVRMGR